MGVSLVNFRYHVVSLIAVFVALSIGVVLGAGPLQSRIYSSLRDQGTQAASASIAELHEARSLQQADSAALDKIASDTLPGTLSGRKVAVVVLPGAQSEDVTDVSDMIVRAGAEIVGSVSLSNNWDSTAMTQYRATLSTPLSSHTTVDVPSDVTAEGVVGYAVMQVLTTTGSETDLVREILTDESTPIMTIDQSLSSPAQSIVIVGARDSAKASTEDDTQSGGANRSVDAWTGLAKACANAPGSSVIVADASSDTSMAAQLRSLNVPVTTVDSPGSTLAALGTALALRDADASKRAFGVGVGADSALPTLP